jgi:hypothetical protein
MFDVEQKARSTVDAMAWKQVGVSCWIDERKKWHRKH